ncbi:zinc-ribbon domain-containing protein [Mariprofundus ferrooxydans]|uniref:zinc-ribbon domain-containing protein n=1 Tax=Mariprofundus ferrooxydans TaxID=314344 RepID=UPI001431AA55|nr:zinc-ribbon domain-containing protein [Mariprofundus ferrooxydans]
MFCSDCGSQNRDDAKFCSVCGVSLVLVADGKHLGHEKVIPEFIVPDDQSLNTYDSATIETLEAQIEIEDPIAMHEVGKRHFEGIGLVEDKERAVELYLKSARLGYTKAMIVYGRVLAEGMGIEKDVTEAFVWYRLAAKRGEPIAQYYLGSAFFNGFGCEKDYEKAVYWYEKASKQNLSDAILSLGWMYENGHGVQKDCKKAHENYLISAELGSATAMENIALDYQCGRGVGQDEIEANRWHLKAADEGNVQAMHWLGCNYKNGDGCEKSWEDAKKWFDKAASHGDKRAEFMAQFPEHKIRFNKNLNISWGWIKGRVIDSKQSSKTDLYSYGGTQNLYGFMMQPPEIGSTTTVTDKLWIQDEQGNVHMEELTNINISTRIGHVLSIFYCYVNGRGWAFHIEDHTAENSYSIHGSEELLKMVLKKERLRFQGMTPTELMTYAAIWPLIVLIFLSKTLGSLIGSLLSVLFLIIVVGLSGDGYGGVITYVFIAAPFLALGAIGHKGYSRLQRYLASTAWRIQSWDAV